MTHVIRPIRDSDLEALKNFAQSAHVGFTSLSKDPARLKNKINYSIESFDRAVSRPQDESYLFALEDLENGGVAGVCGIHANTGTDEPLYFWRREEIRRHSPLLESAWDDEVLRPVASRYGPTEMCSLYLSPDYRKGGLGRLLSLSRLLFMAAHPQRFEPTVIALMRGYIADDGNCPFWDFFGRRFWDVSFAEAILLSQESRLFIPEFLPQHPIYVNLLHEHVQTGIARPHNNTRPALMMLQQEGFEVTREVDIFDGGPKIAALFSDIRVIKESVAAPLRSVTDAEPEGDRLLLANTSIDFRSCFGQARIEENGSGIVLSRKVAEALCVEPGMIVRAVPAVATARSEETALQGGTGGEK